MKDYELLEKQASMMRMAEKYGVDDWRKLVKVKFRSGDGDWGQYSMIALYMNSANDHKFALGVVEGNPVFEGDELWLNGSHKVPVSSGWGECCDISAWSWNPPRPKTVMIEMPYELAEYCSKLNVSMCSSVVNDVAEACSKALEWLK